MSSSPLMMSYCRAKNCGVSLVVLVPKLKINGGATQDARAQASPASW